MMAIALSCLELPCIALNSLGLRSAGGELGSP